MRIIVIYSLAMAAVTLQGGGLLALGKMGSGSRWPRATSSAGLHMAQAPWTWKFYHGMRAS